MGTSNNNENGYAQRIRGSSLPLLFYASPSAHGRIWLCTCTGSSVLGCRNVSLLACRQSLGSLRTLCFPPTSFNTWGRRDGGLLGCVLGEEWG